MKSNKLVLILLFSMMFGLIFYTRSFFTNELSVMERIVGKVQEENVKQLSRVIEAQAQINKVPWLVSRLFLAEGLEKKQYIEEQIRNQIQEVEQNYINVFHYQADEMPLFEYVAKNWRGYKATVFQILDSDKSHQYEEAGERTENSLLYLERLNDGMRLIVAFHERDVAEKTSSIIGAAQLSKYNVRILTISGTLMFLFICFIAFYKITSTESKLRTQVALLAEKNLLLLEQANEINQLAYHDTLTGLPNRHYFQRVLSEALTDIGTSSAGGAVVFLDLDNFKLVNDTYGHDVGDRFLAVIADRIKSLLHEQIFGARFGGDEFVFLLRQFENDNTRILLEKILALVSLPVQVEGVMISPTCSIGVAFFPSHGNSAVELLKKADTAMYQAKAKKNSYAVYDAEVLEEIEDRQRMEQSLRGAIDRKELSLAYQPIINSVSHKLAGLEALLRWRSVEYGEISPAKFIPLAESSGIIVPIGKWVLDEAANMVKILHGAGLRDVYISVNVSVIQFMQDDFLEIINSALTSNIPVDNIKIEITETVLIESFANIKAKIDRVREMGIKICLDDFGTGYSSINYLTQLPLDVLKLDQSLVGRLEGDAKAQAVFENMVRMAHGIGIQVVAEGVENSRQLELIQKLGCDYAQGYYISRPVQQAVLLKELEQGTLCSFAGQASGNTL